MARVNRRIGRSQITQPATVDTTGVGAGFAALAGASQELANAIKPIAMDEAIRDGQASVTRDENGALQVDRRLPLTEFDAAYNQAAEGAYLSRLTQETRREIGEARLNFINDPEGFDAWSKERETDLVDGAPLEMRNAVRETARQISGQTYMSLMTEKRNHDAGEFVKGYKAEREIAQQEMMQLAEQGQINSPEFAQAAMRYQDISNTLANSPLVQYTTQEAELEFGAVVAMTEALSVERTIADLSDSVTGDDIEQASTAIDGIKGLSPAQRRGFKSRMSGALRKLETSRSANLAKLGSEISAARTILHQGGDPAELLDLQQRAAGTKYEGVLARAVSANQAIGGLVDASLPQLEAIIDEFSDTPVPTEGGDEVMRYRRVARGVRDDMLKEVADLNKASEKKRKDAEKERIKAEKEAAAERKKRMNAEEKAAQKTRDTYASGLVSAINEDLAVDGAQEFVEELRANNDTDNLLKINLATTRALARVDGEDFRYADLHSIVGGEKTTTLESAASDAAYADEIAKAASARHTEMVKDPIAYAQKKGEFAIPPVSFADPESLAARAAVAPEVHKLYGTDDGAFFSEAERDGAAALWEDTSAVARLQVIESFATVVPDQAAQMLEELDAPEIISETLKMRVSGAAANAMTDVLEGDILLGGVVPKPTKEMTSAAMDAVTGVAGNAGAMDTLKFRADRIYAAMLMGGRTEGEAGGDATPLDMNDEDKADLYTHAMHRALGGVGKPGTETARGGIGAINGNATILPEGVKASHVERGLRVIRAGSLPSFEQSGGMTPDRWRDLSAQSWRRVGGVGAPLVGETPLERGQIEDLVLVPLRGGRAVLALKGSPDPNRPFSQPEPYALSTASGQPYIIDVNKLSRFK